ncbi:MAG: hypothetical protein EA382_02755 [Spirochaetaceae bacterium]|nr:MAG: hypothetical protein EA382_02755 [Spirochaetaceae bacterium]
MGEEWGSWIDPNDTRDAIRLDTGNPSRAAHEQPKTTNAKHGSSDDQLAATNDRLRGLVADLCTENGEISDMLDGTGIASVFLDSHLRVVRSTPAAKEIGYDRMVEIVEDARSVLDTRRPKKVDIQARNGRWYRADVRAYRTVDDAIGGVAISFVDISEHRIAEHEAARRLADKETLLKEVHHRVRNNTSSIVGLLSIQAQSIASSEARTVLQGAIGRLESMTVLYDKLLASEQYGESSVKGYLEDLADRVVTLFPAGSNTTLDMRVADFDLKSDTLFLLGLITNELLTNVMKYAFDCDTGGVIILSLEKSANQLTLTVQDNGVGLPPGFDLESTQGFGLTLVNMLARQLGGSFSISTQNGTRSVLELAL